MQKVPINHALLESGAQLLSNSKSCLGNTFQFEQFTDLSLFQGNTLMIGDKYVRLFDNDLHIYYCMIVCHTVIHRKLQNEYEKKSC